MKSNQYSKISQQTEVWGYRCSRLRLGQSILHDLLPIQQQVVEPPGLVEGTSYAMSLQRPLLRKLIIMHTVMEKILKESHLLLQTQFQKGALEMSQ